MTDEEQFRAAIAAAPNDTAPRLVFADWLDDHGRHEEASRQRRWTPQVQAAEDWLRALADRYGLYEPYPECIRLVVEDGYCHGSGGESLRDDLRADSEFWGDLSFNWFVATGVDAASLIRNMAKHEGFHCGC